MTKETMSEDDEKQQEEILIPVEVDPNANPAETEDSAAADEADEKQAAHDDEDDEDDRISESQDDLDEQVTSKNRDKRVKRRELRKQAKERTLREVQALRLQNEQLMKRLSSLEGNAINNNSMLLDQRLNEASREIEQAEMIIARAIEAQNGQDVAAAMKMRDDAKAKAAQLAQVKVRLDQARAQPARTDTDPRVALYAKEWIEANSWYDPNGRDEDSAITNAIDSRLKSEGYDPATEDYWVELTNRVSKRLGTSQERSESRNQSRSDESSSERRKAPPIGNTREHVPVSTKREIYVSPERKQAMIDAGIWENPEARNKMLKAYRDYDKSSAR